MKNKIQLALVLILAGLIFQSCGHTNKLGKYDLQDKKILFEEQFTGNVQANLFLHNEPVRTGSTVADVVIDVGKAIANGIVEGNAEEKLINAANPQYVAESISNELEGTLVKYLSVKPVDNASNVFFYIVTTNLKEITLNSTEFDIFLNVDAEVEITEHGTADVVWDYCESKTVSLRNYLSRINNGNFDPNVSDIIQMGQLLALSETQLKQVINFAAMEIGDEFSKQFRKDLSKARGK